MKSDAVPTVRLRQAGGDGPRSRDFEEFYTRHFNILVAQACRYADNRELAADAVQDALIDVYRRWDTIDNPAAYAGVAVRRTIWTHHQVRPTAPLTALPPDAAPLAIDASGRVIDYVMLVNCLKHLPDMQRTITALHYFEGWKISDIADQLQIAQSTARAHLVHARRRLRELLAPQPGSAAASEPDTQPAPENIPSPQPPTPITAVRRAQAGDSDAFAALYDQHADGIYRYLYLRVGRKETAEDLTAQTFLRALRTIHEFTGQQRDFSAWLMTIARRLVADDAAGDSQFRLQSVAEDLLESGATCSPATIPAGQHAELLHALAQLSAPQQECLTLRFLTGLSVGETARVMSKTDGAVKTLQHRALRSLSRTLTATFHRQSGDGAAQETPACAAPAAPTADASTDLPRVLHDVGAQCTKITQPTAHAHRRMRARAGLRQTLA
ncbi:sigma-70 family RNA polymerase sigma factor [Streptomyces griseorubiginosus]|uniref:sigma-70 family RNA polymerase sigma factor n=1 Tax=Streptomyces griseorubiginosus TaxID=67304 RepID=UPI0033D1AF6C